MNKLVFPASGLRDLRCNLLADSPNEAAAVLLAGRVTHGKHVNLLIREQFVVPRDGYATQERLHLIIKPAFLAPIIKRARLEGWSILLAHTHPFQQGSPSFSGADDEGERVLMPTLFARAPERPHGALVLTGSACTARIHESGVALPAHVERVVEAGSDLLFYPREGKEESANTLRPEFDRSVRAFGTDGQAIVSKLTVGIVGLGGTGSIVAQELAHLGIGELILLDDDSVAVSNLNRLVGANTRCVGRRKVTVARRNIHRIRNDIHVDARFGSVLNERQARSLLRADLIFCCTDTHGSRAVLNQLAYQYMIPVFDLGMTIDARGGKVSHVSGRVQMLAPGLPCLTCHNLLDPEEIRRDLLTSEERSRDPYILGTREPQPAVISLNGTVASLAVTMMLAAVTGLPFSSRHAVFIGERGTVRAVEATRRPECVVCSLRGAFGRGDLWAMPWRPVE